MQQELIVIARAGEARFFKRQTRQDPLIPCAHLEHPQSRGKSSERDAPAAGHGGLDHHGGGVRFEPRQSPHDKEARRFATEVAQRIDEELPAGGKGSLWLFCAAPFLGELRAALSASAHVRLHASYDVDLTSYGLDELEQRLTHHLRPSAQQSHARRP